MHTWRGGCMAGDGCKATLPKRLASSFGLGVKARQSRSAARLIRKEDMGRKVMALSFFLKNQKKPSNFATTKTFLLWKEFKFNYYLNNRLLHLSQRLYVKAETLRTQLENILNAAFIQGSLKHSLHQRQQSRKYALSWKGQLHTSKNCPLGLEPLCLTGYSWEDSAAERQVPALWNTAVREELMNGFQSKTEQSVLTNSRVGSRTPLSWIHLFHSLKLEKLQFKSYC